MKHFQTHFIVIFALILLFAVPFMVLAQETPEGIVPCDGPDCHFAELVELGANIVNFLVMVAASIMAIVFAWAGITYLTAGGDEGKVTKAHNMIRVAVVGFVIVLASWLIVYTISTQLLDPESGVDILLEE